MNPPSSTAYPRLIREQLQDLGVENCSFDTILSDKPLSRYFDLEYQTNKALGGHGMFTSPFGTGNGMVLDSRLVDIGEQTSDSNWIPWLLRSAGLYQDNTLVWTFNHTLCGLYDPLPNLATAESLKIQRQKFTLDLLSARDLRIVLLCGPQDRISGKESCLTPSHIKRPWKAGRVKIRPKRLGKANSQLFPTPMKKSKMRSGTLSVAYSPKQMQNVL